GIIVSTGPDSSVKGYVSGISADGSDVVVTVDGDVEGELSDGIIAIARQTNLTVATSAGSRAVGSYSGISALNFGTGETEVTVGGEVRGNTGILISGAAKVVNSGTITGTGG